MLADFFKLDPNSAVSTKSAEDFVSHFDNSRSLTNIEIDKGAKIEKKKFENSEFENVNFSHCVFHQVTFTNCKFVDCLFIGTQIDDCEFHGCQIIDCNTYKIDIKDTYINPMCFKLSKSYRNTATNVGLDLYQQLFKNASETHQPEYAADADIFRRRWRRWQLIWELKKEKKFRLPQFFNIASNWLYDLVAVYGYGPGRFAFVSAVIFCLLAKVIQITWPYLGMSFQKNELKVEWLSPCLSAAGAQTAWQQISFTDALYNLLLLMTTLGADGVVPTTGIGKLFVIGSALFGMSWFSLFTAILVRRVIR